jgi:hypothetical protein
MYDDQIFVGPTIKITWDDEDWEITAGLFFSPVLCCLLSLPSAGNSQKQHLVEFPHHHPGM